MMKKFLTYIFLLIIFIQLFSCKSKTAYLGDSMINYPDLNLIVHDYIEPYQKEPYTFRLVTIENDKRDTAFLHAKEVKWDEIKQPFIDANLYKKEFDKQYKIDAITDTLTSTLSLIFTSLNHENLTSKLSIKANLADNNIQSLYAETNDAGFFTSKAYKLLFVNKKTIQIQESNKKPFSSLKNKITTLTFLN